MKVKNDRLYPYPVLSQSHDDYVDNSFYANDLTLEHDSETATIKADIVIGDSEIKSLICDESISLNCHVECSTTKYRKVFRISPEELESCTISIPLKDINDTVEICFVLVANRDIEEYTNPNLNERYLDANITLFKYRTLGFTETEEFKIKKQLDTNGEVPSIFNITKDETKKIITFDCDSGDKIDIYLPADDYLVYEKSKGTAIRIKQMMTVIPVLTEIFEILKSGDNADFVDKGWYLVLEKAIEKIPGYSDGFDSDNFKNLDSSFSLAQKVFREVSGDAFKELDTILEAND